MSSDPTPRRAPTRRPPGFVRDDSGAILVFWAIFIAVAFGFVALTFDLGRTANTQTELQSFADQVALAAVGELDGRPGARDRARQAADELITRAQTFGEGERQLSGDENFTLTLMRTATGTVAANDFEARFARVDVDRTTVLTPFASVTAALLGRAGQNVSTDVGAVAIAGRGTYACDITPLFFCLPPGWRAQDNIGRQIAVVPGGGNTWGPGNFGFIDVAALPLDPTGPCAGITSDAQLYRCLIAAERGITQCIATDSSFETEPGVRQGLTLDSFNVRFDIYGGGPGRFSSRPEFRPAPNVLSDQWGPGAPNLPQDSCIAAGCQFGAGDWNRELYLSTYHNGQWPIVGDDRPADQIPIRDNVTRYDIYLAEIRSARARTVGSNDPGMLTGSGFGLMGRPSNHDYAGTAAERAALDPARRNLIAAGVDCTATPPAGNASVIPTEYVRVFMTEPMRGSGQNARLIVEVVGTAGGLGTGAGEASFREIFQLVR